jgi:hypothetical protein
MEWIPKRDKVRCMAKNCPRIVAPRAISVSLIIEPNRPVSPAGIQAISGNSKLSEPNRREES